MSTCRRRPRLAACLASRSHRRSGRRRAARCGCARPRRQARGRSRRPPHRPRPAGEPATPSPAARRRSGRPSRRLRHGPNHPRGAPRAAATPTRTMAFNHQARLVTAVAGPEDEILVDAPVRPVATGAPARVRRGRAAGQARPWSAGRESGGMTSSRRPRSRSPRGTALTGHADREADLRPEVDGRLRSSPRAMASSGRRRRTSGCLRSGSPAMACTNGRTARRRTLRSLTQDRDAAPSVQQAAGPVVARGQVHVGDGHDVAGCESARTRSGHPSPAHRRSGTATPGRDGGSRSHSR